MDKAKLLMLLGIIYAWLMKWIGTQLGIPVNHLLFLFAATITMFFLLAVWWWNHRDKYPLHKFKWRYAWKLWPEFLAWFIGFKTLALKQVIPDDLIGAIMMGIIFAAGTGYMLVGLERIFKKFWDKTTAGISFKLAQSQGIDIPALVGAILTIILMFATYYGFNLTPEMIVLIESFLFVILTLLFARQADSMIYAHKAGIRS